MKRHEFPTLAVILVAIVLAFNPSGRALAQLDWSQMNTGGFGQAIQFSAFSIAEYNGHYYVGTGSRPDACQVWRYDGPNPHNWTQVNTDGFGWDLDLVTDLVVFNGNLYASAVQGGGEGGGEVWMYDGSSWTRVSEPGFGDPATYGVWDLLVFDGRLWAGSANPSSGAGVWAYDGSDWVRMNTGGFGNPNNLDVRAMAIFNGSLHAGTYNDVQGGELWRHDGPAASDWTRVASAGFGDPFNLEARSLAAFRGRLIIGTANPNSGLEVLAYDGNDVESIDPGTMQFDSARCMAVALNSKLYVGTGNDLGFPFGTQVWEYDNTNWTQANTGGFGDEDNVAAHSILAADSMLLVGTVNNVTGGQVWGAPLMYRSYIPAAAAAGGAENSFFQTDADINNIAPDMDVQYEFWWLPRGADNSEPMRSQTFTLAGGHSVRIENLLGEIFGLDPDVVGAVAIAASNPYLRAMTRTYNIPPTKIAGTFGQALPAVPEGDLIQSGQTKRIIFMSENSDFRANLGCVNGTDSTIEVLVDLYDAVGTPLETKSMNLGPWSNNQLNRVFRTHAPVNGYVDVRSQTSGARFYCYGSVLDNETSDPTSILPQTPSSGQRYYVPAAALAAGAEGAFFQTDVDVNNSGMDSSYVFMWLPRGEDNSMPVQSDSMSLGAGRSARYENVLAEVFDAEPDVVGALGMQSPSEDFLSMSRTYNVPEGKIAGTFGQALPGIQEGDMIGPYDRRRIIFLSQNSDLRANVGCASGSGVDTEVNIELFDADGESLEVKTMDLAPWSNDQINRIFRAYAPVDGYVDVWSETSGALFYCYGSLLDNETSDPTTILPQQ